MGSVNKVILVDRVAVAYRDELRSIPDIATEIGWPRSRVRQLLLTMNVKLRSRADGVRLSKRDGRGIGENVGKYERTPVIKARISAGRRLWGEKNARGFRVTTNGYVELTRGANKGRSIHDVIAEQLLGRPLRRDEVVHHVDHDRANNTPENLAVMTRSEHTRLHRKEAVNG